MEERRREVERGEALVLDQPQRLLGVPARLADEAAADERHRHERVEAHRVVERHDAESAIAEAKPVLEHLGQTPRSIGPVRARNALRTAGRARGVEDDRLFALVEVERAGVLLGRRGAVEGASPTIDARVPAVATTDAPASSRQ